MAKPRFLLVLSRLLEHFHFSESDYCVVQSNRLHAEYPYVLFLFSSILVTSAFQITPRSPSPSILSLKFYRCTPTVCKSVCLVSTPLSQ